MLGRVAATGLAGLGLVGGVAAVNYDDSGNAKVKITENGKTRTVTIKGDKGGPAYSCPGDIDNKLAPIDEQVGRIQLTIRDVEGEIRRLEARYPQRAVPAPILKQFNALYDRDDDLIQAYNQSIDEH